VEGKDKTMTVPFKVNLKNKTAVVTGGTGALCSVMAKALAECGAGVAVLSRRQDAVEAAAAEIKAAGGKAIGVSCDVLDRASLHKANSIIEKKLGPVDILINGAGGNNPKATTSKSYLSTDDLKAAKKDLTTFFDLEQDGINFVFNVNFLGTFLPCQEFSRGMVERGSGCVINVASMAGMTPLTKIPAYSASKAAVANFTRWLAVHLSKTGVRVNAIAPGFFPAEQNRAMLMNPDGSYTERGKAIIGHTPMGRFGRAEELVGALLWLSSEEASGFVTGSVVAVDGGFSAFSGV
jgi:NAD(P)-dependent dehydrogenase (short-subunit alcohol dehydrogenase family)